MSAQAAKHGRGGVAAHRGIFPNKLCTGSLTWKSTVHPLVEERKKTQRAAVLTGTILVLKHHIVQELAVEAREPLVLEESLIDQLRQWESNLSKDALKRAPPEVQPHPHAGAREHRTMSIRRIDQLRTCALGVPAAPATAHVHTIDDWYHKRWSRTVGG